MKIENTLSHPSKIYFQFFFPCLHSQGVYLEGPNLFWWTEIGFKLLWIQSLTFNHCKFISNNETIARNTPKLIGTYRLSSQRWSQSWVSLLVYTCVDTIDKHTLFQFLQTVWRDFFSIQVVCKLSSSDRLLDLRSSPTVYHAMLVDVLGSVIAIVQGVSSWELSP